MASVFVAYVSIQKTDEGALYKFPTVLIKLVWFVF